MTEAEALAFKTGYLIACCNLVHLHDEPGLACDVLAEGGINQADVKAMGLSGYDAEALKAIRKERPTQGDPIWRDPSDDKREALAILDVADGYMTEDEE